ncbi:AlkA N-terminal domain-containing protein [Fusobacterium sp. PH5-44]|uniref:DNA-3-methyladenine glycosylase 2 family protein n=1 Tax=unclassified Fusobacterium TaxID=2648384 RepID=UPI003D262202
MKNKKSEMKKKDVYYSAFKSKDRRFDGHFFVGISSTGIYCRPVCRAKLPKIDNCSFYSTAAAAEHAGYRPCLLCRPELAPGTSIMDAQNVLAQKAMRLLEDNCGSGDSLEELSRQLGCTSRHLRRVFMDEYGVSPVEYLQTCRLLLAKRLLTDTDLSILDTAMSSGFGSLRRFNDLFKKQYGLIPTELRKKSKSKNDNSEKNSSITIELSYRPPYQWDKILDFLSYRAITGVEIIKNNKYMRTVHLIDRHGKAVYGWISVGDNPSKNALTVTISLSLLTVLSQVISRVKNLFDLYCEPYEIQEVLKSMNEIKPNLFVLGVRLPGSFDMFEMAVRAILGQQITVKAAGTLATRIVNTYGKSIDTEIDGLTHVFPSPHDIIAINGNIADSLGPLGIIRSRANIILELSRIIVNGEIDFSISANPDVEIKKLLKIKGIGPWTAHYIAMRSMKWTDGFLISDYGVKKALEEYSPNEIIALGESWKPWGSYATVSLWNSL